MLRHNWSLIIILTALTTLGVCCEDLEDFSGSNEGDKDNRSSGDVCSKAKPTTGDCVAYEAEDRSADNGSSVSTNHAGFTGSGFIDFGGNGTWIEWNNIAAPIAGEYTLTLRYANGSAGDRQSAVLVNGQNVVSVPFSKTGSWKEWRTTTTKVDLRQGNNTLRIMANTATGGPNLDNMLVVGKNLIVDNCPSDPQKTEPGVCGCGVPEGKCTQEENIALGKPTSQSSIAWRGDSARAVDGNTSGNWGDGSITHTALDQSAWWQVDLGSAYRVTRVSLFNRQDCCSDRLSNFHVDLLDQDDNVIASKDYPGTASDKTNFDISAEGVHAVRVQLYGKNHLALAEVQVFAASDTGTANFCAEAKENAKASLACPNGEKITSVDFASYGLPTGSCDTDFQTSSCHASSSKNKVEALCLGQSSCTVSASNGVFGDPCSGKSKKLAISYTCGGDGSIDQCPNDPLKTEPGECGCGVPEGSCGQCTNTLKANEKLLPGEFLCSENGKYQFGLTASGELSVRRDTDKLWSAGAFGSTAHLIMQGDGNLVVYNPTKALWSSRTSGNPGATLKLENDGRVVILLGTQELWSEGGDDDGGTDQCPNDPDKTAPGKCGCGVPEGTCGGTGELKIAIFSVRSGDSSLIVFPTGKTMLVDSGTEANCNSQVLPFLKRHGVKRFDYYVETHPHPDHAGGAALLRSNGFIDGNTKIWDWKTHQYKDQFVLEGTKWFISNAFDRNFNGTDTNMNSLSFRIEYNGFVYSASGDQGDNSQDRFQRDFPSLVPAHVRNTAHHMWGPVSKNFLISTDAYLYVISCYDREWGDLPGNFRSAMTYLEQNNRRLKEWVITGDSSVGHVVIRASGKTDWGYEFCPNTKNCVFNYLP